MLLQGRIIGIIGALALFVSPAPGADDISSAPVGNVSLTIKGDSDTVLSAPLAGQTAFTGTVANPAPGPNGAFLIEAPEAGEWTDNEFAGQYYVRFTSGMREGMYYTIAANTASQLTLQTDGDDLSGVAAGSKFVIVPHWTLASLFPPAAAGTSANPLTPSADLAAENRRSEVLLPDPAATGTDQPPAGRYFFTADAGWVADKPGNPPAGDTIIAPDASFIVRQPAAVAADATWEFVGRVVTGKVVVPLSTQAGGRQDNAVGLIRPVPVSLAESGIDSAFVESLGLAGFQKRDSLLVFDNTVASHNKSASKIYIRHAGTWYDDGTGQPVGPDVKLEPGSGFIIRKYQQAGSSSAWWANLPTY